MTGYICGPKIYEFEGVIFETPSYGPPWPLKKDGSPKVRAGKVFFNLYAEFDKLTNVEKDKYRVGGGCTPFT